MRHGDINYESFQLNLTSPDSVWNSTDVIPEATNLLYDICEMSTTKTSHTIQRHELGRGKSILQTNNPKLLWDRVYWVLEIKLAQIWCILEIKLAQIWCI